MSWTTPKTFTAGAVLPASDLNTHLRDNTNFLYGQITPTEFNAGNSGTAKAINFASNGPLQKVTRTGNCTFTLTAPSTPGTVILRMVHEASATAYTVTFSPTVKFPDGTAPTWTNTSGAVDILTLYWDGTTWWGVQAPAFA